MYSRIVLEFMRAELKRADYVHQILIGMDLDTSSLLNHSGPISDMEDNMFKYSRALDQQERSEQ